MAGISSTAARRTGPFCEHLADEARAPGARDRHESRTRGRSHGRPVDLLRIPAFRFLGYLQDHDQVGNRATGDRISARLAPGLVKIGAGLVLTAPFTPMLFMGEEWAASTPWQYFTDHTDPELARAVAAGRRAEFAAFGCLGESQRFDPATRSLTGRPVGWQLTGFLPDVTWRIGATSTTTRSIRKTCRGAWRLTAAGSILSTASRRVSHFWIIAMPTWKSSTGRTI